MDDELDRSVRLLEEAVKNKSLHRPTKQKHTLNISGRLFDYDEIPDLTVQTENLETEQFSFLKDTTLARDFDERSTGLLSGSKPWENSLNSLYTEYLEIIAQRTSIPQIFETVSAFAGCCSDTLSTVRNLKTNLKGPVEYDARWLENERNTWRLIFCLYQERLNAINEDEIPAQYFGLSEKLCIENLYRRDTLMRESQLIIDWLECNALDREIAMPKVEYFTDNNNVYWENTLHQLESVESIVFKTNKEIITELDPDAPFRQKKALHDLDLEDDNRLSKKIFVDIRCGKFDEAQKLCNHCGQGWRAALLEGWRLYHDPNANHNEDTDKTIRHPIEGNYNRDLWKQVAWKYCLREKLNVYERAALAAFCGSLNVLLKVCKSWEDQLWSYMKTMVDIRVESEIRDFVSREYRELPPEYWNNKLSIDEIFEKLEASPIDNIKEEAEDPDHIIQKFLILDQIPQLMIAVGRWITRANISPHFVRFLAHLILFLRQIGHSHNDEIGDKVLETYVKILIEKHDAQLVAYYTSTLKKEQQIELYSSFLEKIVDNTERKEALKFGEDAGLDVRMISRKVSETIINAHDDEVVSALQRHITEMDQTKISALDWVLFDPSQSAEAIVQSNFLVSYFLILGKLEAAKLAFGKIPTNAIDRAMSGAEDEVPEFVHKAIREHLSYKTYLDAHDSFNAWFNYYHHSKPVPPPSLSDNATFPEKVAHEHKQTQYQAEFDRWKMTVQHLAKSAKTMMYNVLLFPDGGWLTGADNAEHLRCYCIPEMFVLLYSILSELNEHVECLQLTDILVSEKYGLYKVFTKNKLDDFLQKIISETIDKLLEEKNDNVV